MEQYIGRCQKILREMGAPLDGRQCSYVIDEESGGFTCELCGCEKVRFVHVMEHDDFAFPLAVGCICAGAMESDLFAAEARDRKMKNRAKRKRNFLKHTWKDTGDGVFTRTYRKKILIIREMNGVFICLQGHFGVLTSNEDFPTTLGKLFDIIDPLKDVM